MSLNKPTFGGILEPLIGSLDVNSCHTGGLTGKDVVIPERKETGVIIALDKENNIHLLIAPAGKKDSRLSDLGLKGLKIKNTEWSVSGRTGQHYLDVSCSTGIMPSFRRPFLRFAEDALFELSQSPVSPVDAVYKTCVRWKKFWSSDSRKKVTGRWIRGLFGELIFLTHLIKLYGLSVINSWTGPLGKDHDFQTGTELAVEVKTSNEIPFRINCNIRQLDQGLFRHLYLVCYRLEKSETGGSLPELVGNITELIKEDVTALEKFYALLANSGYSLLSEDIYNSYRLKNSEAAVFGVDQKFPKISENSFKSPPDHRISNIRYVLQLTGVKQLKISDSAKIFKGFKQNV